jgi:hypothetical protein
VRKTMIYVCMCLLLLLSGCNKPKQMTTKDVQNTTLKTAANDSVQRAFSDGRIQVMKDDRGTKRALLHNTLKEQQMMLSDTQLRPGLLRFQINTNELMLHSTAGKEQMKKSTLGVMRAINNDPDQLSSLIRIQTAARQKSLQSGDVRTLLLQQNLRETAAVLHDPGLQTTMLKQYISAFGMISSNPALRTEMADALLPLLKDPKIAKEMEKMMKLLMAKEMKKMMAVMKQAQKMQLQQMQRMQKMQQMQMKKAQRNQQQTENKPLE